jgi:hypothetical protein
MEELLMRQAPLKKAALLVLPFQLGNSKSQKQ